MKSVAVARPRIMKNVTRPRRFLDFSVNCLFFSSDTNSSCVPAGTGDFAQKINFVARANIFQITKRITIIKILKLPASR